MKTALYPSRELVAKLCKRAMDRSKEQHSSDDPNYYWTENFFGEGEREEERESLVCTASEQSNQQKTWEPGDLVQYSDLVEGPLSFETSFNKPSRILTNVENGAVMMYLGCKLEPSCFDSCAYSFGVCFLCGDQPLHIWWWVLNCDDFTQIHDFITSDIVFLKSVFTKVSSQ